MTIARVVLIVLAGAAAIAPLPAATIDAWYSRGVYPPIQNALTTASNLVSIALFDPAIVLIVIVIAASIWRVGRRSGAAAAVRRGALTLTTSAAAAYLVFLLLWGLNYRRLPLEATLEFDANLITQPAARRLGELAVQRVNAAYAGRLSPTGAPSLEAAFAAGQRLFGSTHLAIPGVPKRSLLTFYFRRAAIDGMTDPFFLEIIVNPEAFAFERPFIVAHEWAHLAGYAHEAEANFVAWVSCTNGDELAQYSGWLAIYEHVRSALPRADRAALNGMLDPGPREDLRAIAERYERSVPVVRDAAREVYDSYLRANRVREGIASYTGVVRLMLGAGVADGRVPRTIAR